MTLKPSYRIVSPREDLREGKPLDAAKFAVYLDHARDGRANNGLPPHVIEVPVASGRGMLFCDYVTQLMWTGEVPAQKWMNFYTNVFTKFVAAGGRRSRSKSKSRSRTASQNRRSRKQG